MVWLPPLLFFSLISPLSVLFVFPLFLQSSTRWAIKSFKHRSCLIFIFFLSTCHHFALHPAPTAHFTNGNFSGLVDLTPAQDFIAGLCLLIPSILFVNNTSTNRHCCWDCDHTGKYAKIIQSRVIKFLPCFHRWDTPLIQSKCECKPNHPTCLAVQ